MYKILLLPFFISLYLSSKGQSEIVLNMKLDSIHIKSEKVDFIIDWANNNYIHKPDESLHYLSIAFNIASKINYNKGLGLSLMRMGVIEKKKNHFSTAKKHFDKSIKHLSLISDSLNLHKTLFNRSTLLLNLHKYDLALKDLYRCIHFFENTNNLKAISQTHNNFGLVFKHLNQFDKALIHYKKAASFNEKLKPYNYHTNNNIANIYSIQNNFQEALSYYQKNLDILKEKPNQYQLAQTYHNIGSCFFEMDQYRLALDYLNQSLELKEKIGNKNLLISTINSIAHIFYQQELYTKALKYRQKSLSLAIETKNIEYQKNCNEELFKIFSHLNKCDSALFYFSQYKTLKDSIFNHENLKRIAEIQEKYESEKKENQILLLEKESKSRMMQRNWLSAILLVLAVFAIFLIRSYYIKRNKNRLLRIQKARIEWHKNLLDQKNNDLLESNRTKNKLFQIISHDLRSPLASVYNISQLIKIFIQQKKYDSLSESTNDMEECVNNVLSLTDNLLSWSLNQSGNLPYRPVIVSLKPLFKTNIKTFQSLAKQKNIHLELILENDLFAFADRQILDTVIRNLINNALKFTSPGGIVAIGAKQNDGFIEIWLKDSGIGISESQLPNLFEINDAKSQLGTNGEKGNGLGLVLCKQFAELNKGTIWVESIVNKGTTFRFTVPCGENTEKIGDLLTSNSSLN